MAEYPGIIVAESDPVAEGEKGQPNGIATLDGTGNVPLSQLGNAPTGGGGGGADASTTVKGISKLSVAPSVATNPIAAGDNDPRLTDQRVPTDGSVTAAKVASSLKPSGSAAATDESLRRLGTGSTHAAAGDDSRFPTTGQKNALAGTSGTPGTGNEYVTHQDSRLSDQRVPTDGSVTAAKVAASLKPSGSAASTDEALRALGTTAGTAAAGNDSRLSDARTPTAHAASHASAGSDPITIAESQVTGLVSDLAAKAPLASPALTGTPTVPTAAQGTNTTQAASTAYVQTEVAAEAATRAAGDTGVGSLNTQTSNYTLVLGDAGKLVKVNSASGVTVTIPPNSSVAFAVGTTIEILRYGSGSVTIAPGSGVTIPNRVQTAGTSNRTVNSQMSSVSAVKIGTDEWYLVGDLA